MLQPAPHQATGSEATGLNHHLNVAGHQLRSLAAATSEPIQLQLQRLESMAEDSLLQLSPCCGGKHPLARQRLAPCRRLGRQQVVLEILIQHLGLQQAAERQGLEILHGIHPLSWVEAQLPQPG